MIVFLATLAFLSEVIFSQKTPYALRVRKLSPHFHPAIGSPLRLDPYEIDNLDQVDPLSVKGFVRVAPPKGQCFTIRRSLELPDISVCKPRFVPFEVRDIDDAGRINWEVTIGANSLKTQISWPTPYRLAQFLTLTEKDIDPTYVAILSCKAINDRNTRKVIVTLLDKKRTKWHIYFPKKDRLMPQPRPEPNLTFITLIDGQVQMPTEDGSKKDEPKGQEKGHGEPKQQQEPPKTETDPNQNFGKGLFLRGKKAKKIDRSWSIPPKGTYIMNSSNFKTLGGPMGSNGKCVYRLRGAPGDPDSGVIECRKTDSYNEIYTHLPCTRGLL